ncbi:hypothetical protein PMAYCL1PPCAC_31512, partial [Pristionchus mayeri]
AGEGKKVAEEGKKEAEKGKKVAARVNRKRKHSSGGETNSKNDRGERSEQKEEEKRSEEDEEERSEEDEKRRLKKAIKKAMNEVRRLRHLVIVEATDREASEKEVRMKDKELNREKERRMKAEEDVKRMKARLAEMKKNKMKTKDQIIEDKELEMNCIRKEKDDEIGNLTKTIRSMGKTIRSLEEEKTRSKERIVTLDGKWKAGKKLNEEMKIMIGMKDNNLQSENIQLRESNEALIKKIAELEERGDSEETKGEVLRLRNEVEALNN